MSATLGRAPGVLWTIPVELTFYVYLPFILALAMPATRSRLGAAALASAYLAWCIAIALARHEGAPASPWMTLGFHHYANAFVGGVLFYALIANGRIRFPPSAAWIAALAPLAFVLALPFCWFTLFRHDPWMAEMARAGGMAVVLRRRLPFRAAHHRRDHLRPSPSFGLTAVAHYAGRALRKTGELSFGVYLLHIPMITLIGSRYGVGPLQFSAAIAATFAAAAALSALIEKPAIAFGRELALGSRPPRRPAIFAQASARAARRNARRYPRPGDPRDADPLGRGGRLSAIRPAHFDIVEELARALLPGETHGMFARLLARDGQRLEAGRPQILVEHARAGRDDIDRPGHGISRDRQAAGHRLDHHDPERVGARGEDEHVRARIDVGQRFALLGAEKMRVAVAALEARGAPARRRR